MARGDVQKLPPQQLQTTSLPPQQPPGLINAAPGQTTTTPGTSPVASGAPVTSYDPATATATNAEATPFTVGKKQTVAGQLNKILAEGSPLMQQAETNARMAMNSRGLINSSQAISAGQSALYGAAMPIATADAGTYNQAAFNTAQAQNVASLQNAQLGTQTSQFNAGQQNAAMSQAAGASNQVALTQLQGQNAQSLQQLVNSGQLASIGLQGQNQKTIQELVNSGALANIAAQGKNQMSIQELVNSGALANIELQGQNQQALQGLVNSGALANIDAQGKIQTQLQKMSDQNKLLLQTSQGAAQYYNTMLQYMASISTNPNMTHDQKANALTNAVTTLNDALDTLTNIVGIPGVQSTLVFTGANLGGTSPAEIPASY